LGIAAGLLPSQLWGAPAFALLLDLAPHMVDIASRSGMVFARAKLSCANMSRGSYHNKGKKCVISERFL